MSSRPVALTRGEISLAQWHRMLRHGEFACALVLMCLSLVALSWALELVGIPVWLAYVGAVFIEVGMAGTASAATTIRKPGGGYYLSLWAIFSFMMALAQAANVGHALVEVSGRLGDLPPWMDARVAYVFAAAFAALFPLGGTMLIHVSGFLRVHGADAQWVDAGALAVEKRAADSVQPPARPRTATAQTAHTERAPEPSLPEPDAPPLSLTAAQTRLPERERARALYEQALRKRPGQDPVAAEIRRVGQIEAHDATVRRWVQKWLSEDTPGRSSYRRPRHRRRAGARSGLSRATLGARSSPVACRS